MKTGSNLIELSSIENKFENQYILTNQEIEILESYLIENKIFPIGYIKKTDEYSLIFENSEIFIKLLDHYLIKNPEFTNNLINIENTILDDTPLFIPKDRSAITKDQNELDKIITGKIVQLIQKITEEEFIQLTKWLNQLGLNSGLEPSFNDPNNLSLALNLNYETLIVIQEFVNSDEITRKLDLVKIEEFVPKELINKYKYRFDACKLSSQISSKFIPLNPEDQNPNNYLYKNSYELNRYLSELFKKIGDNLEERKLINQKINPPNANSPILFKGFLPIGELESIEELIGEQPELNPWWYND